MLIVQKFGGSSVADAARIHNVASRIAETYKRGNKVVVVLSAQGDTTDDLIEKAKEIMPNPPKRELDMLLSTGEQQCVSLMSMALNKLGLAAVSLNGVQAGITTSSVYGNSRVRNIDTERIQFELEKNNIVIVTGFQGINRYGDVTTLGRGGSDLSAVALAAVLHADLCEIYTDVEGIYTADPRIVKNAHKLKEISYDEMLELASLGAKVLQNRSVELAKKYNVVLTVRSSLSMADGTVVKEDTMEKTVVSGVAVDKDVARISVIGLNDSPGVAFKVFAMLAKYKIAVDIIIQSIGRDNTKDISFTVTKEDLEPALKLLNENKSVLGIKEVASDSKIAKVSIVGAGMYSNPGVASTMFEALFDARINISMISTSEIKISVLIEEKEADRAMNAIHDKFNL